jgi:hypothetical protein
VACCTSGTRLRASGCPSFDTTAAAAAATAVAAVLLSLLQVKRGVRYLWHEAEGTQLSYHCAAVFTPAAAAAGEAWCFMYLGTKPRASASKSL